MKTRRLGRTDLFVSEICLGTMTWGSQNSEAEAHEQMDYAFERDVTFWDTAELYPVTPISPDTQGRTEEMIGTWLAKSGKRDRVVLATKIAGNGFAHIRESQGFVKGATRKAVEGSLKRLQTDYIDLYQLHWPQRGSYHFRQHWKFDPTNQDAERDLANMEMSLRELAELIEEGKIRHIGLSNESAWGTMQFLRMSEQLNLPRVATIQNEYNLLCRYYDIDLSELSHHEDIGLLAFSPLATGLLTGKYANGALPEGSRGALSSSLGGRNVEWAHQAVSNYQSVADKYGMKLNEMSIAFCLSRPFMLAPIIGATTLEQLKSNIDAADLVLTEEILADIGQARRKQAMPI